MTTKEQVQLPKDVAEVVYQVIGKRCRPLLDALAKELSQEIADKVLDHLHLIGLIP